MSVRQVPSQLLIAVALAGVVTGCMRRFDESIPPADKATALEDRMREIDAKIAGIERSLGKAPALSGTGAYARGSTVRIAGNGQETVLERVRRLEQELAASTATIKAKETGMAELVRERDEARASNIEQTEKADYLSRTREDLTIAQQTLRERQERIDALHAQLSMAELQRLRAERSWYALASEVLRLTPDEIKDLPEIQARIRDATRDVRNASDTTSGGRR